MRFLFFLCFFLHFFVKPTGNREEAIETATEGGNSKWYEKVLPVVRLSQYTSPAQLIS